jgi:hypothetical protein
MAYFQKSMGLGRGRFRADLGFGDRPASIEFLGSWEAEKKIKRL